MLAMAPQHVSRRVAAAALRGLAQHWRTPMSEWPAILARSKSTVYSWLREDDQGEAHRALDADVAERLSHLVSIYNGLHLLFGDDPFADEWMHVKNRAFGGIAPIDLIKTGHFSDIFRVRNYVDHANAQ